MEPIQDLNSTVPCDINSQKETLEQDLALVIVDSQETANLTSSTGAETTDSDSDSLQNSLTCLTSTVEEWTEPSEESSSKLTTAEQSPLACSVIHIHNRTPNRANDFITPFERFTGRKPEIKFIRRFGCAAYVLNSNVKRSTKFNAKARRGFLLECNETGYTVLDAKEKTQIKSKHVDFIESKVYGDYVGRESNLLSDDEFEVERCNESEPIAMDKNKRTETKGDKENEQEMTNENTTLQKAKVNKMKVRKNKSHRKKG